VWPVGPNFMTPAEMKQFEQHQIEEKQKMWEHSPQ
jgi:hypothetical protein